ncbi:MAG TPA: hypothetical protein VNF73_17870, partial [Candidatus Saccharimonadales bacterium]|nr:hypothetical protein [Candidatus Saccharimonadales bacterium]
ETAVLGRGAGFAFRQPDFRFHAPDELPVDTDTRSLIEEHYTQLMEAAIISGPPQDYPVGEIDPSRHEPMRERHAQAERETGELVASLGYRGERYREAWVARMLIELTDPINEAMLRAGIDGRLFPELGAEGMTAFLHDLPVASAVFEIRFQRHRAKLAWTANDLNDMHALAVAVVHADVVVTERHAASLLKGGGLDVRNGTTVLTDLADLGPILVRAAA